MEVKNTHLSCGMNCARKKPTKSVHQLEGDSDDKGGVGGGGGGGVGHLNNRPKKCVEKG